MTARRRSRAGRRSPPDRDAPRAGSGRARSREAGDGRATVACPQCGTLYRVPEEQMDGQLQCRNCRRTFNPKAAGRTGARSRQSATPFIMGGAILVFVILVLWLTSQGGQTADAGTEPVKVAKTDEENPRVRDVQAWAAAIRNGNSFALRSLTDLRAVRALLGIPTEGANADELDDQTVERLLHGEETELFRRFEATSAVIQDIEDAENREGDVRLYMAATAQFQSEYYGPLEYSVTYRFAEDKARVTGWEVIVAPRVKQAPRPVHKPHDEIGAAKIVKREFGGEEIEVAEAELVPLGHLEGTSSELQKEIDQLIAEVCDLDQPGKLNRAIDRLVKIGRPSIPRLLNKMFETPLDTQDNVLRLRRITQALNQMTGQRFGFNPSVIQSAETASTEEHRKSVLRQWYGWWSENYDRPYDAGIDKGDDLLEPRPAKGEGEPGKVEKAKQDARK